MFFFLSSKLTIIASEAERNDKHKEEKQANDISAWAFGQRASELRIMVELFSCERNWRILGSEDSWLMALDEYFWRLSFHPTTLDRWHLMCPSLFLSLLFLYETVLNSLYAQQKLELRKYHSHKSLPSLIFHTFLKHKALSFILEMRSYQSPYCQH